MDEWVKPGWLQGGSRVVYTVSDPIRPPQVDEYPAQVQYCKVDGSQVFIRYRKSVDAEYLNVWVKRTKLRPATTPSELR